MRRALAAVLMLAGVLALADAALTLVWQEPVSALAAPPRPAAARARELRALDARDARALAARQRRAASAASARALRARDAATATRSPRLRIPRIGLDAVVVRGHAPGRPREAPGPVRPARAAGRARDDARSPGTARPTARRSATSTACAAATRSRCAMPYGTFRYAVEGTRIVDPADLSVLRRVGHDRLVLSACHPLYSAARRIVVFAAADRRRTTGQSSQARGS